MNDLSFLLIWNKPVLCTKYIYCAHGALDIVPRERKKACLYPTHISQMEMEYFFFFQKSYSDDFFKAFYTFHAVQLS